jgi:NADH:ubiquinone oxidoreductase subunit H
MRIVPCQTKALFRLRDSFFSLLIVIEFDQRYIMGFLLRELFFKGWCKVHVQHLWSDFTSY